MSTRSECLTPQNVSPEPITRSLAEDPSEEVEAYARKVIELQQVLINAQRRLRAVSVGVLGLRGRRDLSCIADALDPFLDDLSAVQAAAIAPSRLTDLDIEIEVDEEIERDIERLREQGNLYRELERLERLREQTFRQMNGLTNTANTRLGLTISVLAILLSAASILMG